MRKLVYCICLLLCLGACTKQAPGSKASWTKYELGCITSDGVPFALEVALWSRSDSSNLEFLDKCRKKLVTYTIDSLQENYESAIASIWSEAREDNNVLAVEFSSR